MTQCIDIRHVAQCSDQTDNRAKHAERRRIHACLGENQGTGPVPFFHQCDIEFQNITDKRAVHPVDNHRHPAAQK